MTGTQRKHRIRFKMISVYCYRRIKQTADVFVIYYFQTYKSKKKGKEKREDKRKNGNTRKINSIIIPWL